MAPRKKSILVEIFGKDKLSATLGRATAKLNKFGKTAKGIGRKMTAGLTLPIVAMGAAAVKASFDFNEGMANVATLIPGNIKRVKELKENVLDMSAVTGQSANDISAGLFQVISAYGDTADTVKTLDVTVRAGIAGQASATDSLSLLSAVTKGYGDTSAEAQLKVANMAFVTNKLGQTTFPELAASLPSVIALSEKLNVSQEELFTTFATLTGVTGNTSKVATQFEGALGALIKPTTEMKKTMMGLGFASGEAMIKQLGFQEALKRIVGTTSGTSIELGKLVSRKEGLTAVMALTGKQADVFSEKLESMKNSAGALDEAFKEQTDGINKVGFAFKRFKALVISTAIKIGDRLGPSLERIFIFLTPLIEKFGNLSPKMLTIIIIIAGIAAAIGPLLIILGTFATLITPLAIKIVAIGIAISTLIGFVVLLWKKWKDLSVAGKLIISILFPIPVMIMATVKVMKLLVTWVGKLINKFKSPEFKGFREFVGKIGKFAGKVLFKQPTQVAPITAGAGEIGNAARTQTINRNTIQTSRVKIEVDAAEGTGTKIRSDAGGNDMELVSRGAAFAM